MSSLHLIPIQDKPMVYVLDPYPQSAVTILSALEDAIDQRMLARVAMGDLPERHFAILELVKLSGQPDSDVKTGRLLALIQEFGREDVERWQQFIGWR